MNSHFKFICALLQGCVALVAITQTGCATGPSGPRIDNIPMYGQPEIPRPDFLKKVDEDFINQAVAGLGSREKASEAWWLEGEKYMAQGNLDFAMRRYNQSWLLNPNNYQPYWGFGRVMIEQDKVDDSIRHLERAKQLSINDNNKAPLLADLAAVYAIKGEITRDSEAREKMHYFSLANENFKESIKLDPSYANAWRQWAMALFRQGDYAGAWEKVKEAQARNAKAFPPAFIRDLQQKMPKPK